MNRPWLLVADRSPLVLGHGSCCIHGGPGGQRCQLPRGDLPQHRCGNRQLLLRLSHGCWLRDGRTSLGRQDNRRLRVGIRRRKLKAADHMASAVHLLKLDHQPQVRCDRERLGQHKHRMVRLPNRRVNPPGGLPISIDGV